MALTTDVSDLRRVYRTAKPSADVPLPPELAFLPPGLVDDEVLASAAREAQAGHISAARVLIANGHIRALDYYKELADHLDVGFIDDWLQIAPVLDVAATHRAGFVGLVGAGRLQWLAAPQDGVLGELIDAHRAGRRWPDLAITTPARLAGLIHLRSQAAVERAASDALPDATPHLSAKGVFGQIRISAALAVFMTLGIIGWLAPRLAGDFLGVLFLFALSFRHLLFVPGSRSLRRPKRWLSDADLPSYTVLVALRSEADVVPELIGALKAIDYPRAKLEVLILIEPEDSATLNALKKETLPPWLQVVFGPIGGALRTKPRALNTGLLMARGDFVTVFDAEDRPCPNQLRQAAALFAEAPRSLACLQARLRIDNGTKSWLARMFAIEYATLFDVLNPGISDMKLPMALGGTSTHFRSEALREVGGWDAWNVTEDADLGLRLARFGYDVAAMSSITLETAPEKVGLWMKQRRRWTKGWMQTSVVLLRDAPRVAVQLGWKKTIALVLLLSNLVVGPLLFPFFSAYVAYRFSRYGFASPSGWVQVAEATVEVAVVILGLSSTFVGGLLGIRANRTRRLLSSLLLLVPYQLMISVAACMGLWDLTRRPYHWHKTAHTPRKRRGAI